MSLKTPINNGLAQTDLDLDNFRLNRALLDQYAGVGMSWNGTSKKFDVTGGGGGGIGIHGTPVAGQPAMWFDAATVFGSTWPGHLVSVKDPPYNAKGDGTTDDTAAVTQAIYDTVNAGGGTVFFPHGIYQCNGALSNYYYAVLTLPFINANTTPTVCLRLVGENHPLWSVATANDETRNSTIRTATVGTSTAGTNYPSILTGSQPHAPGTIPYSNMNNLFVWIQNMNFIATDPAMNGVRLDGVGWTVLECVGAYGGYAGGGQDTTGIWLPESQNFSINVANLLNVAFFNTGIRTGEHLRAPRAIQVVQCGTGVEFCDGIYPSQAYIQTINVAASLRWSGQHPVDLLLETEHAPGGSPPWQIGTHDVEDPSNFGRGIVKYFIGQGGNMNPPIVISQNGGTGLAYINLMAVPSGGGAGAVSSVFGRTGAVAAAANDYNYSLIGGGATGWTTPTGTGSRAGFNVATATITQCAATLQSLITDLKALKVLNP